MLGNLWKDYHISIEKHGSPLYKRLYSLEGAHSSPRVKKYHRMDDWQVYVSYRIHRFNLMLWFALFQCFPFICFSLLQLNFGRPSNWSRFINSSNIIFSSIFILWHLFLYSYHTLRWMHSFLFLLICNDLGAFFSGYNYHNISMVPWVFQTIIAFTAFFANCEFVSWTLRNNIIWYGSLYNFYFSLPMHTYAWIDAYTAVSGRCTPFIKNAEKF